MGNFPPWEFMSKLPLNKSWWLCSEVQLHSFHPLMHWKLQFSVHLAMRCNFQAHSSTCLKKKRKYKFRLKIQVSKIAPFFCGPCLHLGYHHVKRVKHLHTVTDVYSKYYKRLYFRNNCRNHKASSVVELKLPVWASNIVGSGAKSITWGFLMYPPHKINSLPCWGLFLSAPRYSLGCGLGNIGNYMHIWWVACIQRKHTLEKLHRSSAAGLILLLWTHHSRVFAQNVLLYHICSV